MEETGTATPVAVRKDRQTSAMLVLGRLRGKILRGEYAEGAPLRQEALAAEFGVSRIPVREALRQLETEGLVTFVPHVGAVVSVLSLPEIQQLFELRELLETDLLRRAIPTTTTDDLARAEAALASYKVALDRGDPAEWGIFNRHFHAALLSPADQPVYMKVLDNLLDQSDRYMRLSHAHGEGEAYAQHVEILEAVRRRETPYACALLSSHILGAAHRLRAFVEADRARSASTRAAVGGGRDAQPRRGRAKSPPLTPRT